MIEELNTMKYNRDFNKASIVSADPELDKFTTQELLSLLAEGSKEIKKAFENAIFRTENGKAAYNKMGTKCAPIAFEIFKRLQAENNEPRLHAHLVSFRSLSTHTRPDSIEFWDDPDAISGLYDALNKEGHYASPKRP
jgi:hypothetical protein